MFRKLDEIERLLDTEAQSVSFLELRKICEHYFGPGRQRGGSHLVFRTGTRAEPTLSIQPRGRMAKPHQCRQVAAAIRSWKQGGR